MKISEKEEAIKINTLLLEKIRNLYNRKMILITDLQSIFNDYKHLETFHNLNYLQINSNSRFYKVFDHKSSLGNEIVAQIYFNSLIGKKIFFLNIIKCHFKKHLISSNRHHSEKYKNFQLNIDSLNKEWDKNLFKIQSIQLTDGNNVIASLRHNSSDHHYNGGSYNNHKIKSAKSFIAFFGLSDFLHSSFIPLSIQLKEDMKIYIQLKDKTKVELGQIRALDAYKKLFVFYSDFITGKMMTYTHYKTYFNWEHLPDLLKQKIESLDNVRGLFVENLYLGQLQQYHSSENKDLRLSPINGYQKSFLMMGAFSNHIREKLFPMEFPLYIQYKTDKGESFKSYVPEWHCKKEKQFLNINLPKFDSLKLY